MSHFPPALALTAIVIAIAVGYGLHQQTFAPPDALPADVAVALVATSTVTFLSAAADRLRRRHAVLVLPAFVALLLSIIVVIGGYWPTVPFLCLAVGNIALGLVAFLLAARTDQRDAPMASQRRRRR